MEDLNITDLLIDYTNHVHRNDPDRTKHLHVTDVTSRCPVGTVLEKAGIVTKIPVGNGKMLRFEVGHIVEEFVRLGMAHAGQLEKVQKVSYEWKEYNMVGSPDLRMIKNILTEVKSIHPMGIDKMDGNPERKRKPHQHYFEQVQLYLQKERELRPECQGKLFYVSLDGRTIEFTILYDQEVVDTVLKRAAVIHECIQTGKRPTLPQYFTVGWDKRGGCTKWELNWKVMYCILDGIHEHCDPETFDKMGADDAKSWVSKLTYQANKANKNGTNPNEVISGKTKKVIKEIDGITYEPID